MHFEYIQNSGSIIVYVGFTSNAYSIIRHIDMDGAYGNDSNNYIYAAQNSGPSWNLYHDQKLCFNSKQQTKKCKLKFYKYCENMIIMTYST